MRDLKARVLLATILGSLSLAACHKNEPGQLLSNNSIESQSPSALASLPRPIVTKWPQPVANPLPAGAERFLVDFANPSLGLMVIEVSQPDAVKIAHERLRSGQRGIVSGHLLAGDGGFNTDGIGGKSWSWHLDPDSVSFPDFSTEVCDGGPLFVEQDLAYWLQLGRFCPWSARLVQEF